MTQMVVLIVDDPDDCGPILTKWESIGVTGVTILESSGLGRLRRAGFKDDLPIMPSLEDLFQQEEVRHRTLLSVVEDSDKVAEMVEAAQSILGDLDVEHSGFIFVVPITKAYGLGKTITVKA